MGSAEAVSEVPPPLLLPLLLPPPEDPGVAPPAVEEPAQAVAPGESE